MSNILTDILGLDARGQYKGDPLNAKDVFVIGDVHQPRMLGISSPIPIRDEKLVTFYDLALSVIGLLRIENTTGSPPPSVTPGAQLVIGPDQTGNPFLWKVRTLTSTDNTVAFSYTGADSELVDLSMTLSTDVHVSDFRYYDTTHVLRITLNSGSTFDVDISNLALEVLDDSVSVDTNVTQISFDGPGVTASLDGTGITVVEISQGKIEIAEEGIDIPITPSLERINFTGAGITASSAGAGTGTINVDVPEAVNTVTFDPATNILTIRLTTGTLFNVDLSPLSLEILDDNVSIDTGVTQISFDGPGVTASLDSGTGITEVEIAQGAIGIQDEGTPVAVTGGNGLQAINFIGDGVEATTGAAGTVDVTIADQEEVFLLMASNCEFTPVRVGEAYTTVPPINPVYRFGGGAGVVKLFKPDFHNWNDADADVTVGANPQSFVAKEDQITQAIPIPVDLLATDKINVSGTCYVKQHLSTQGQAKIKVAVGQGECADDLSFNVLNAASIDTFAGVAEDADGNERHSHYQRMCFDFDVVIGGDGAQAGEDHFFIGFSFEGLNLPTSGDYTEVISVNWNMSAIKNPS